MAIVKTDDPKKHHDAAMSMVDDALALLRKAVEHEEHAASLCEDKLERAVLYRSAACIALQAERPHQAARLAGLGLAVGAGDPQITIELCHVVDRAGKIVRNRAERR